MLRDNVDQSIRTISSADDEHKLLSTFGSYVGRYVGRPHHTCREEILLMLELNPTLVHSTHYAKLTKHDSSLYPVTGMGDLSSPSTSREPRHSSAQRPGMGTERISSVDQDANSFKHTEPFAIHVAKKLLQLHSSAERRNITFTLDHNDVAGLLLAKTCYFTDELLTVSGLQQRTIDRLDSTKGYERGNVVACTYQINQLKSYLFESERSELFMTPQTLLRFMLKMKPQHIS